MHAVRRSPAVASWPPAAMRSGVLPAQQLLVDLEDAVLAMAEDDQLGGLAAQHLAAQLAADRAAAAGDQHAPAPEQLADCVVSVCTGSRRNRSSMSTSRSRLTLTLPPSSS